MDSPAPPRAAPARHASAGLPKRLPEHWPDPSTLPPAGTWRRSMGAVYESVVLFGVVVFFGYGFSALLQFHGEPGSVRWGFQAFLFLVIGTYFGWFWSQGRRTLPMKTVSLLLVGPDSGPVSPGRAWARYTFAWAMIVLPLAGAWYVTGWFALLLPIPFFWSLFDRERRTLYDLLAGTRLVVHEPPKPAKPGTPAPTARPPAQP